LPQRGPVGLALPGQVEPVVAAGVQEDGTLGAGAQGRSGEDHVATVPGLGHRVVVVVARLQRLEDVDAARVAGFDGCELLDGQRAVPAVVDGEGVQGPEAGRGTDPNAYLVAANPAQVERKDPVLGDERPAA